MCLRRPRSRRLSAGRKLADKFEIVGVLGEGGMGIVYDARRLAEGDRVALKVIHQHLAGDAQIRGRFAREAAILRRLEGDHLCPVLDFGEIPDPRREGAGLLYMALPAHRRAGARRASSRKRGPSRSCATVTIVLDVCEALREAHAQGVIHRDLKPGNVLLREGDRAVVVDFGMAKIVTGGGTGTTALTQHNMVFGTPEYMAPEQARGDELDARCDVYATGIILYELLTGRVPFSGPTPLNVLTAHLTEPAQPPRTRAPERGISPALEAVVDARDRQGPRAAVRHRRRARDGRPRGRRVADGRRGCPPGLARQRHRRHDRRPLGDAARADPVAARPLSPRARRRMPSIQSLAAAREDLATMDSRLRPRRVAGIALGAWLSLRSGH